MIQSLIARIQLMRMRAEEGQALVEYALILSLIAVVSIGVLTILGGDIKDMLGFVGKQV